MNELRLALLVIGILILVLIYFYGQWELRRKGNPSPEGKSRDRLTVEKEGRERLELSEELTPKSQETAFQAMESRSPPPLQTAANPRRGEQEEEFLENLNGLTALVEEAKDHKPKNLPERAETMTTKKAKTSRFHFPRKWMRKKTDSESTSESVPPPKASPPQEPRGPELILVLTVVAPERHWFRGQDIIQVLEERSLQYGEMNIYHAYSPGGRPIFSVANMMEPGTFDLETIDNFTTPGLTLFSRLPGPAGGFAAFDAMLDTARMLAERLHGEIRDERRNVLTNQAIAQTRERILAFNRTRRSLGV